MTTNTPKIVLLSLVLLTAVIVTTIQLVPDAEATKAKGVYLTETGSKKVCGDRLCSEAEIKKPVAKPPQVKEEAKTEKKMEEEKKQPKATTPQKKEEVKTEKKMKEEKKAIEPMKEMEMKKEMTVIPPWQTKSGTILSEKDPGIGHETHQLAIILPPSDKLYRGQLTYSASENIQLVALHGPLGPGEDRGQAIWTPDGKTKFALTFVDNNNNMGTWRFAGNALAVHTMNTDQFAVSYSVTYRERVPSDTVMGGTIDSMKDPGIGHETHQLAIILPPSDRTYNGILTYSASEPIQLVALHGPLLPGQDKGQPTWSTDGVTKFALTFVDPGKSMGSWAFSGNAIAVHTMNPEKFSVSYSAVAGP